MASPFGIFLAAIEQILEYVQNGDFQSLFGFLGKFLDLIPQIIANISGFISQIF